MTERRALLGGIGLIIGAVPIILTYGFQPLGYVGIVLAVFGAAVSYGAYQVDSA